MTKWLTAISPRDRAVDVAARSLESRLRAVHRYLRRAVKKPNKPENVHQLRVWSRRSAAALALYADLPPNRDYRRMKRMLRRIRKAAGHVRDCDVFGARLVGRNGQWPERLRKERVRAQRKLVTLFDELDGGRKFKRRYVKLRKRMLERNERSTESFADRARESLRPVMLSFIASSPLPASAEQELHRFRIAGKELRYAMELLAGAFPIALRDEVYPVLVALQEKLGHINDLSVARDRLSKQLAKADDPGSLSEIRRRLASTEEELAQETEAFHRWWTPEARDALRSRFESFL